MRDTRVVAIFVAFGAALALFGQPPVGPPVRMVQIQGRVLDTLGNPLPSATIGIKSVGSDQMLGARTTDQHGSFVFPNIGSGFYELRVSAVGFVDAMVKNVTAGSDAVLDLGTVVLRLGQPFIDDARVEVMPISSLTPGPPPRDVAAVMLSQQVGVLPPVRFSFDTVLLLPKPR